MGGWSCGSSWSGRRVRVARLLLLARAGHEVLVVDGDAMDPAADVASAPEIVQPHIVLSRCRELLTQRLPDVYGRSFVDAFGAPLHASSVAQGDWHAHDCHELGRSRLRLAQPPLHVPRRG